MWQRELRISLAFFHTQDFAIGINLLDKKGKLKGKRKLKISVHGCKTRVKYEIYFFDTVLKIILLPSFHSFEDVCLQQRPWENSNKHCVCQEGKITLVKYAWFLCVMYLEQKVHPRNIPTHIHRKHEKYKEILADFGWDRDHVLCRNWGCQNSAHRLRRLKHCLGQSKLIYSVILFILEINMNF